RLAPLGLRVLRREQLEQLLQEVAVGGRQLVESRPLETLPGVLVRGGACAAAAQLTEVDQALGRGLTRDQPERLCRVPPLRLGRVLVAGETLGLVAEGCNRFCEVRPLAQLEHEPAAGRAKRLVDAGQHAAEPVRTVGREQSDALRALVGAERVERALERLP